MNIPLVCSSKTVFKSFRGAPRPYGNTVSYCNAAFLTNVLRDGKNDTVIESVRLAFDLVSCIDVKHDAWLQVKTPSQNHFYMETQSTLAIPDEDDCITIYTACQAIDPFTTNPS